MLTTDKIIEMISQIYADQSYELLDLIKNRQNSVLSNEEILKREITSVKCPKCGSEYYYRNGHTKTGKQKFICKVCKTSFSMSNGTILYGTKKLYYDWIMFVHFSLIGLTLKQISLELCISQTTAFIWRQKLFYACHHFRENLMLSGKIEIDAQYFSINLKGTKSANMPRYSKKRKSSGKRGISNHKVCVMGAIDENDQILMIIAGTGPEDYEKMKVFDEHIKKGSTIISDGKFHYRTYAQNHELNIETIKAEAFINDSGYNLANINSIHSEFSTWLTRFKGVSTRHFQGYIDMFLVAKTLGYKFEDNKKKDTFIYNNYITSETKLLIKDVFLFPMPINVEKAYSDFKE